MTLLERLEAIAEVRTGEPLSRHTTFGIGGPADLFAIAKTREQLRDLTRAASDADAPVFVLGSGSNVVVGDGGITPLDATRPADTRALNGLLSLRQKAAIRHVSLPLSAAGPADRLRYAAGGARRGGGRRVGPPSVNGARPCRQSSRSS